MNVVIFSSHAFETPFLQQANRLGHGLKFMPVPLNADTAALAAGHQVVSIFVNDDASAPVLEQLAALGVQALALRAAGYNNVDLEAAHRLGLRVLRVPAYSPHAVAEHCVALMLALNRKLVRAHQRVRELNFSLDGLVGFDMHGKTVGLIGLGKIGAVVARILNGFGCRLLGYDPNPSPELLALGMRYAPLDEIFAQSDIISLHVPLLPETHYIINAERLARMKRGVMIINTSRGGLVCTRDVIEALKTGQIGYLGLDVYEDEKGLFFSDHSDDILQDDAIARLMTFPNVLITSHQAFLTHTALTNIADTTFDNIAAVAAGAPSENEVK